MPTAQDPVFTHSPLHLLVIAAGPRPVDALHRALLRLGSEQRIPHEIHILAASEHLENVRILATGEAASRFAGLCAAAGIVRDEVLFNQRTLHAVDCDRDEAPDAPAERVLHLLSTLTATEHASLTVVVAADAGACGHLVHAALHVVGRVSDRLLLDATVPSDPSPRYIAIPLLLWPATEPVPATFADAVGRRFTERRRIARPDPLRLELRRRLVIVGETTIALPAMQFFWYAYLASTAGTRFPLAEVSARFERADRHPRPFVDRLEDGRPRTLPDDLRQLFARMFPLSVDKFDAMYRRACGPHPGLPSTISKTNAALRRALGGGAAPYLIQGGRGSGGYRIALPGSSIAIADGGPSRPSGPPAPDASSSSSSDRRS